MPIFQKTVKTPPGFVGNTTGTRPLLDKIYVGFVKDNKDAQRMGRLRVFIPEISADTAADEQDNPSNWITVNYCSPFAGATNILKNDNEPNSYKGTQKSYGFWFVPPDLENEVLVVFVNGDPSRGFWIGCVYQQFMNNMVPGLAGSLEGTQTGADVPRAEYNKKAVNVNPNSPIRPEYDFLATGLRVQGLINDRLRGTSTSSARRNNPENSVYGILSPGGSQFVLDDHPQQQFIRLRTKSGTQILLSESEGSVYIVSRDGNSWLEVSQSGFIDLYGTNDISVRSQGSINLRADKDINIEAGRSIFVKARNNEYDTVQKGVDAGSGFIKIEAATQMHVTSQSNMYITSNGEMHTKSVADHFTHSVTGTVNRLAGADIKDKANNDINEYAGGNIVETATQIQMNGPQAAQADPAVNAETPLSNDQIDQDPKKISLVESITTNTIVYRLPSHEPFSGHSQGVGVLGVTNHVESSTFGSDLDTGAITENQQKPLDVTGTPRPGMAPGYYQGKGYDNDGNPIYEPKQTSGDLNPAGAYSISTQGLERIQKYEGYKGVVYKDAVGLPTIGYGHLLTKQELSSGILVINGQNVKWENGITNQQGSDLFRQDIVKYEEAVRKNVQASITQSQFDALCSFCYNLGTGGFAKSSVVQSLNAGNYEEVPNNLLKYVKAKSSDGTYVVLPGLVNRRTAEASQFQGLPVTNV